MSFCEFLYILGNLAKKSVLQEDRQENKQWEEGNPNQFTVEEGPYPYRDLEPDGGFIENNNRGEYQASLNSENRQSIETYPYPTDVIEPRENYFTLQKDNRRYDTVITQAFGKKPERKPSRTFKQMDPALGSEYVSYPQDSMRGTEMEPYWNYVPVDSRLEASRDSRKYFPVQGEQRSVEHWRKDVNKLGVRHFNRTAPKAFTDRHSVGEEPKNATIGKEHAKESEKSSAATQRLANEEESGRKRQHSNIYVRNRSPEASGRKNI